VLKIHDLSGQVGEPLGCFGTKTVPEKILLQIGRDEKGHSSAP
jgi:hypothetical protein